MSTQSLTMQTCAEIGVDYNEMMTAWSLTMQTRCQRSHWLCGHIVFIVVDCMDAATDKTTVQIPGEAVWRMPRLVRYLGRLCGGCLGWYRYLGRLCGGCLGWVWLGTVQEPPWVQTERKQPQGCDSPSASCESPQTGSCQISWVWKMTIIVYLPK